MNRLQQLRKFFFSVEGQCWIWGLLIIAAVLIVKTDNEIRRSQELAWARERWSMVEQENPNQESDGAAEGLAAPALLNTSEWSRSRIDSYYRSIRLRADAPVATLQVASLNLEVPVYPDTTVLSLDRGTGVISGSALPGFGGNLAIAGHRDGFFRSLRNTRLGEEIEVATPRGLYRYRVTSIYVVDKYDVTPLADTVEATVTLVTCYPFYFLGHAPKRFIVRGVLSEQVTRKEWSG